MANNRYKHLIRTNDSLLKTVAELRTKLSIAESSNELRMKEGGMLMRKILELQIENQKLRHNDDTRRSGLADIANDVAA